MSVGTDAIYICNAALPADIQQLVKALKSKMSLAKDSRRFLIGMVHS